MDRWNVHIIAIKLSLILRTLQSSGCYAATNNSDLGDGTGEDEGVCVCVNYITQLCRMLSELLQYAERLDE